MVSILECSEEEHRLIQEAQNTYDKYFISACECVDFSWDFIQSVSAEAFVFNAFLTQTNKFLQLSLLSLIRHHTMQCYLNLRTAIESTTLACYALHKTDENEFIKRHDVYNDILLEQPGIKTKANKWLDLNYKTHSEKLKIAKTDNINKYYAHSNLVSAFSNVDFTDPNMSYSNFFDKKDIFTMKFELMALGNIALTQIDLIGIVIHDYSHLAKLAVDFEERKSLLFQNNFFLYDQLTKEPFHSKINFSKQE
ncbi:hypothetical protein [Paenibacillus tianjinensis]|uniref:HEPN AbiU2-like domain-containing protein n=1 Tax=Paenibacillus tianjinensis TaxID=2810347 RepID=A0ABX7L5F1_9BACL|nr:hypothetical protein [Paenibacillus tianjinensis]QSF43253.1 hypothetical protein JRJ22_18475 [Paenibacillus tianjinensis]